METKTPEQKFQEHFKTLSVSDTNDLSSFYSYERGWLACHAQMEEREKVIKELALKIRSEVSEVKKFEHSSCTRKELKLLMELFDSADEVEKLRSQIEFKNKDILDKNKVVIESMKIMTSQGDKIKDLESQLAAKEETINNLQESLDFSNGKLRNFC